MKIMEKEKENVSIKMKVKKGSYKFILRTQCFLKFLKIFKFLKNIIKFYILSFEKHLKNPEVLAVLLTPLLNKRLGKRFFVFKTNFIHLHNPIVRFPFVLSNKQPFIKRKQNYIKVSQKKQNKHRHFVVFKSL